MTQFLPWLRSGLATTIDGDGSAGSIWLTPSVNVVVEDGSYSVAGPQVRLRGPGDVLALNPSEIKRRVPEPGSADAETNYFCSVELFAPDLPWRYTPATPSDDRCPPWLVLVVVELGEGVTITTGTTRLAVVHVEDPVADLPDLADSWAWAHVQVTTSLDDGVPAAFDADPTAFSSRLLCPRRLRPDTAYTACLVPAFAAGRDAGLGLPASTSTDPAWTTGPVDLPIYDSWELTAGDRADFKMLAHRITPGELPPDVGFRDLDLRDMGTGMTPLPTRATFAGAMHAPRDGIEYWHDDGERQQFERDVRGRLVTTPPRRPGTGGYDPLVHDPVVAAPAYGAAQLGTKVVPDSSAGGRQSAPPSAVFPPPPRSPGWFEELNIAPHHRAVAGLGSEVVRADQEALMAAAWEQAHAAIGVNRTLNRGRLVEEAARHGELKWNTLTDADAVSIAAPSFVQMRDGDGSLLRRIETAGAPGAYFGSAFRRLGRRGGPLATDAQVPAAQAPAVAIARTVVESGRDVEPDVADPLSVAFRARHLPSGMDVGATLVGAGGTAVEVGEPIDGFDRASRLELRQRARSIPAVTPVTAIVAPPRRRPGRRPGGRRRVVLERGKSNERIALDLPDWTFELERPVIHGQVVTTSTAASGLGFDLGGQVRSNVRPQDAIVASVRTRVVVPDQLWPASTPVPTRVGLEPRFTDPMYERVRALSVDYLVPGVGSMPNNIVSLLEINPAYIEAFLVGLNHEMSRELRWREYPADLRQTWFQRFFDTVDPPGSVDVRPIDAWDVEAPLGEEYGGGKLPGLVLLIRADLIRKFPDVRVYAVPAIIDADGERVPDTEGTIATPTFVGTLGRGINFYGFDTLTEEVARGDGPGHGWFFVLEEEPRAMRFGLDQAGRKGAVPASWNNLGWRHLVEEDEAAPWFCSIHPSNSDLEGTTIDGLTWGDDAAVMAAITFRRPIQVFMHASAMLPGGSDG